MSSKIKVMDFLKEVDYNRKKLIDHARANDVEVSDNISLSAITNINTQFGKTEIDEIPQRVPDPAVEGPFDIIWIDYDGTELFKEVVEKGGKATQFTGEPNLYKQFPDILEWSGWSYNGSLDNVYRDVIVYPTYTIKADKEGRKWNYIMVDIPDNNTAISFTFYSSYSTGILVDWGDGSPIETIGQTGKIEYLHTYTTAGKYIIKLFYDNSVAIYFNTYLLGSTQNNSFITHMFNVNLSNYNGSADAFKYLSNLEVFINTLKNKVTIGYCFKLKMLVVKYNPNAFDFGANLPNLKYLIYSPDCTAYCWATLSDLTNNLEYCSFSENATYIRWGGVPHSTGGALYLCQASQTPERCYIPKSVTKVTLGAPTTKIITIPENVTALHFPQCDRSSIEYLYIKSKSLTFSASDGGNHGVQMPDGIITLKYIELPDCITTLPNQCFSGCINLQVVDGKNIKVLGSTAFNTCKKLVSINFKPSILGEYAFSGCASLKNIDLSDAQTLPKSCFAGCTKLQRVTLGANLQTIGISCFEGCTTLNNIDLYNTNLVTIEEKAFINCNNLKSLDFPATLVSIGPSAFSNCASLQKIDLQNTSVTSIGINAFSNTPLNTVILPQNLNINIGSRAFGNCYLLNNINFNSSAINSSDLFYYNGIKEAILPEGSSVLSGSFYKCPNLQIVDFSKSTVDCTLQFSDCGAIQILKLPKDFANTLWLSKNSMTLGFIDLIDSLKDLTGATSKTLTINTNQKTYLDAIGLTEKIINKNWTLSTSSN